LSLFVSGQDKPASGVGCRSPPASLNFHSKKFRLEVKDVAYNHGREERKWRLWKEAEEKILRQYGVEESTIEEIRIYDRAEFNSNRRFYRYMNDVAEYLEEMADTEPQAEVRSVEDLLNEIDSEALYRALLTVDKRTLLILLLKMQGYTTKEIAPIVGLTTGAIYARLDHLRKKLKKIL
jgi:RNA polymerase sigma factor (sigma-70 family)